MKLIEQLIEEGGSDSSSRNFVSPKISENVVRLIGRHFPSYVESDCSKKQKNIAKICDDIQIDDKLRVRVAEKIPTDGVIIQGHSSINESMITGEAIPVEKQMAILVLIIASPCALGLATPMSITVGMGRDAPKQEF
ncbi:hypothetical protein TNCV_2907011 [Trichonephila clavipes]|nr:hypothetical protein TNCV_2907011 [Trichonephila clavipes]